MFPRRALWAALASAIALAGCGTAPTSKAPPRPSNNLEVAGHACAPGDYAMPCALQRLPGPPVALAPPGAVSAPHGIDFAWSCPSPAGWSFGASYLSPDASKNWSPGCVGRWHAAGAKTVPVWESSANRAQQGFNAGWADAFRARAQARGLGMPDSRPIDYAVDCDCSVSSIFYYFGGAVAGTQSILHITRAQAVALVNAYGGYAQVRGLYLNHVVGHTNWQTYAWSGGRWLPASIAPLEQYLNANAVDYDRAIAPDYGQWPITAPRPPDPYAIYDRTVRHFGATTASERGTVTTWDRARCRNPVRRSVCRTSHAHLVALRNRLYAVAHRGGQGVWGASANWSSHHRGARFQGLQRRLHQH